MDEVAVQAAIDETAARLGVERGTWHPFVPDRANRDAGTPFWSLDGDTLHYQCYERGKVIFDRTTTSLDQLLEWIFHDVTWSMASDYERAHRVVGPDSRRLMFATWVELATRLSPVWGRHVREYVERVLTRSPYVDDRP